MDTFHPNIYININNDLKMTKFSNPNTAKFHFSNYGLVEGRPYCMRDLYYDFRPEYYNAMNVDLQKYKMKPVDLALHYLSKGRFEGRQYKPDLERELIYLYTDNINYSRAEYFENLCKSNNIPCKIITDGILNTNSIYILFTHRQIKLYPFYFILYLDNYEVPNLILELSQGIILDKTENIDNLKKHLNKLYLINDSNQIVDDNYLLKRILLSNDFNKTEIIMKLSVDKIYCLTQFEHNYRFNKFNNQRYKAENLEYILGLKNTIPWIGCANSYKTIIENAERQELPYITICNDDVVFREETMVKYEKIMNYLKNNKNWDIFVGINNITDPYLKVINKIKIDDSLELLQIDLIDTLAFTVFRSSVYNTIKAWSSKFRMYPEDTIIKYLLRNQKLVILTINPFIVDYNYDVYSTVHLNKKNEIELNKIRICENTIMNKKLQLGRKF